MKKMNEKINLIRLILILEMNLRQETIDFFEELIGLSETNLNFRILGDYFDEPLKFIKTKNMEFEGNLIGYARLISSINFEWVCHILELPKYPYENDRYPYNLSEYNDLNFDPEIIRQILGKFNQLISDIYLKCIEFAEKELSENIIYEEIEYVYDYSGKYFEDNTKKYGWLFEEDECYAEQMMKFYRYYESIITDCELTGKAFHKVVKYFMNDEECVFCMTELELEDEINVKENLGRWLGMIISGMRLFIEKTKIDKTEIINLNGDGHTVGYVGRFSNSEFLMGICVKTYINKAIDIKRFGVKFEREIKMIHSNFAYYKEDNRHNKIEQIRFLLGKYDQVKSL
jgi:hypothetical protein